MDTRGAMLGLAFAPHGLHEYVAVAVSTAYGHIAIRVTRDAERCPGADHDQLVLMQDFDWHAMEGKRCTAYGERMKEPSVEQTVVALVVQAIVLEPCRFLTSWFMRRSSIAHRTLAQQCGRAPPLCGLVWA